MIWQRDLGPSSNIRAGVNEVLQSGLPVTFELGLYSLCFALLLVCWQAYLPLFDQIQPGYPNGYGNDWHLHAFFLAWASNGASVRNLF